MKKWTSYSGYTALKLAPEKSTKILDINPGAVIEFTGEVKDFNGVIYERVMYGDKIGWVDTSKVEDYTENFERDCVYIKDIQTPDTRDAEQYVLWKAKRQVNLCGELAICYELKISLSELLVKWEVSAVSFWRSVFGSGFARGTGESELVQMYNLFGQQAETLQSKYKRYTPELLSKLKGAIVGVKISSATGRLNGGGVGHWVVIVDTLIERTGYGLVYVYNPYPNRIEVYSYAEFLASARAPYGVLTTR